MYLILQIKCLNLISLFFFFVNENVFKRSQSISIYLSRNKTRTGTLNEWRGFGNGSATKLVAPYK